MSVEYFLDTDVFVYLFDETDDFKRERAERLVQRALDSDSGCISYQVVQETMNVITGKLKATPEQARQILDRKDNSRKALHGSLEHSMHQP